MRRRMAFACALLAMATVISGTGAVSASPGFKTGLPSMLAPVKTGVAITPLLTVGDDIGTYQFEAIPDGISVRPLSGGLVELYVNHETSKVPFPYNPGQWTTDPGESQDDFDNSQVSKLTLDTATGDVLSGAFAIPSSEGFQRFCSNYLATSKEGFTKDILFTNEESPDYVLRQTNSWPVAVGDPNEEENGVVVALDVATGAYHAIYGMGRHNHENDVAIPGFDKLVVMSGDDTFTSGPLTIPAGGPLAAGTRPSQSQLYSYQAGNTKNILADKGDLWAFVSDNSSFNDYYDFTPNSTQSVSGRFIKVPRNIATGLNADGSEITAADVGFPAPPNDGSWQRDLRTNPLVGIDGPQWVLEYWSQLNNVFDFVRVEDIAYDKRPGMGNVVYVVDSGRGTAPTVAPFSGPGLSTNGRVWKMVLSPDNPKKVTSLSVFVEGDDNPVKTFAEIHQPDNIETTQTGILVTEDPGSSQQFNRDQQASDPGRATTARLWYVPFSGAIPEIVAKVDQSTDESTDPARPDVDPVDTPPFTGGSFPISPGNWGAWESSGIVDASAAFGPGYFLIDVQAHTFWVDSTPGPDTTFDSNTDPDFTYKREGGQLLLIHIPGI
jgi:hypothetical protein